jgi:beta-lactamase superfamily II metal-dependent hydrolase
VTRWQRFGARVMRTDRDGGVTVTVDGHGRVDVEGTR